MFSFSNDSVLLIGFSHSAELVKFMTRLPRSLGQRVVAETTLKITENGLQVFKASSVKVA